MSFGSVADVVERAVQALAVDADLAEWCLEEFGRLPEFRTGMDRQDHPKASPTVWLAYWTGSGGDKGPSDFWTLGLGAHVENGEKTESTVSGPFGPVAVVTYAGPLQAQRLLDRVCLVLAKSGLGQSEWIVESDDGMTFPWFAAGAEISLQLPTTKY